MGMRAYGDVRRGHEHRHVCTQRRVAWPWAKAGCTDMGSACAVRRRCHGSLIVAMLPPPPSAIHAKPGNGINTGGVGLWLHACQSVPGKCSCRRSLPITSRSFACMHRVQPCQSARALLERTVPWNILCCRYPLPCIGLHHQALLARGQQQAAAASRTLPLACRACSCTTPHANASFTQMHMHMPPGWTIPFADPPRPTRAPDPSMDELLARAAFECRCRAGHAGLGAGRAAPRAHATDLCVEALL